MGIFDGIMSFMDFAGSPLTADNTFGLEALKPAARAAGSYALGSMASNYGLQYGDPEWGMIDPTGGGGFNFPNLSSVSNVLGSLAGPASAYFGYQGQQATNEQNLAIAREAQQFGADEAAKNRAFQREMSDTAARRRVNDLIQAGLNPMLAYNDSASSPAGNAAPGVTATMHNPNAAGISAYASAAQIKNLDTQNELLRAQVDRTKAETVQSYSSAGHLDAQRDNLRQEMQSFNVRMLKLGWETRHEEFRAGIASSDDYIRAQMKDLGIARAEVESIIARAAKYAADAKLLGLKVPHAIQEAAFFASDMGRKAISFQHAPKSFTSAVVGTGMGISRDQELYK